MFLYIRCVLVNRVTLAGYLLLILSVVLIATTTTNTESGYNYPVPLVFYPLVLAAHCLTLTFLGTGTMRAYRKASIDLHRNMDMERFVDKWIQREYCMQCGATLALYDHLKKRPPDK